MARQRHRRPGSASASASASKNSGNGTTLAELLVGLAILAILAALAYPSWQRLLARQQVELAADRLAGSLALARATAVARRADVLLAPLPGATTLDQGWSVAVTPRDGSAGADPPAAGSLLAVVELRNPCLRIALRSTAQGNPALRVTAVGYSRSEQGGFLAATFTVRCQGEQRQLRLSAHGRVRLCTPGQDADCDGTEPSP